MAAVSETFRVIKCRVRKKQKDIQRYISQEKDFDASKIKSELYKMKDGSIAKIEQITTISKQRIFDLKGNNDVLSGIQFTSAAMDKINERIKELKDCNYYLRSLAACEASFVIENLLFSKNSLFLI